MKKVLFVSIVTIISTTIYNTIQAQISNEDPILGIWYNEEKNGKIKLQVDSNGKLFGEIIWLLYPNNNEGKPKLDIHNKDLELQSRQVLGLQPIWGFDKEDNEYINGYIYDPQSGKTYKCKISFDSENNNILKIRGYIGVPVLGKTTYWTRTTK